MKNVFTYGSLMYPQVWDRVVRGVAHKWAYVMLSGYQNRMGEPLREELAEFIAAFYPQVALPPET